MCQEAGFKIFLWTYSFFLCHLDAIFVMESSIRDKGTSSEVRMLLGWNKTYLEAQLTTTHCSSHVG